MSIGEELCRLRKLQGLSLRDVAKQTGISASTLSRIENGATPPSPDDLARFAMLYRADYSGFMRSAGYLDGRDQTTQYRRLLADIEVSEDEAGELLSYLEYLRWRKAKQ